MPPNGLLTSIAELKHDAALISMLLESSLADGFASSGALGKTIPSTILAFTPERSNSPHDIAGVGTGCLIGQQLLEITRRDHKMQNVARDVQGFAVPHDNRPD